MCFPASFSAQSSSTHATILPSDPGRTASSWVIWKFSKWNWHLPFPIKMYLNKVYLFLDGAELLVDCAEVEAEVARPVEERL